MKLTRRGKVLVTVMLGALFGIGWQITGWMIKTHWYIVRLPVSAVITSVLMGAVGAGIGIMLLSMIKQQSPRLTVDHEFYKHLAHEALLFEAILRTHSVLPALIGIDPELDKIIAQVMAE